MSSFRERLSAPWWLWALAALFSLSLGIAFGAPFTATIGSVICLACGALLTWGLLAWSPTIEVRQGVLYAGRAHLELEYIAEAIALDPIAAYNLRGPAANPLAWMLLRSWIPTAVRIDLADAADPTPYWFISTRKPTELVAALKFSTSS